MQEIAMQTNFSVLSGLVFSPAPLHPRNQPAIRNPFPKPPWGAVSCPSIALLPGIFRYITVHLAKVS